MRTDYTKAQVVEMGRRVPIGTKCYFSDYFDVFDIFNNENCLMSYVRKERKDMKFTLLGHQGRFFGIVVEGEEREYYHYIFPVDGFEALGIYPADEIKVEEFAIGDRVECRDNDDEEWFDGYEFIAKGYNHFLCIRSYDTADIVDGKNIIDLHPYRQCRKVPEKKRLTLEQIKAELGYDFDLVEEK